MFYLVATNAKDLEPKDKDKCLKSRNKLAHPNFPTPALRDTTLVRSAHETVP